MENRTTGNRIIILGCPGSGKSTLARELQLRIGLPLIHLDNLWWKADRTHIAREEFDSRLQAVLQGEKWIIDGDYSRTYEPRFAACDTVIFLDCSEEDCMVGITERVGKTRADMPWAENRLDPELVEQVENYRRVNRPAVYRLMEQYPDKQALIFRTRAQAQDWVAGLPVLPRDDETEERMIHIEEIPVERIDEFWEIHIKYLVEDGVITDEEDVEYFSGREYRAILEDHMRREPDRQHMVYFCRDGKRIGAASYCTYQSEDGKCFILDYWIFPAYRGNGAGHRCFEALAEYTRADGARYYELNSTKEDSVRFWRSLGFAENGRDEYDMPLFIKR